MGLEYKDGTNDKGFVFISKVHDGGLQIVKTLVAIKDEFDHSNVDEDIEISSCMKLSLDLGFSSALQVLLSNKDLGKVVSTVFCSLNPESSIGTMFEGLRIFKNGAFCVITDKNLIIALNVNLKNWKFITQDKDFLTSTGFGNEIFSIRNEFDLGKATGASIKDEADCKFHLEINKTKNVFLFGDDYTLEIFQRHVMTALYGSIGGKKVKLRIEEEKKENKK